MEDLYSLGRAVAQLRQARGMTQQQLATLCGLGQSTLARFETGGVAEFGSRKLLRLLGALGHELSFVPRSGGAFTLDDALAERQRQAREPRNAEVPGRGRR
ncbi:helix-turn-helix domain-containing protein [Xylophilus sp. Leaf220]|uniref:helix-turn-helix domain-containing protein n=1 Tax=Xylophilus sp. Leaf220 TaxID=1735686 RepID=UPI0006FA1916|nr:helix-turn-helix transcriptional regulator [Xylophilus sp. Leaf220]KQM77992.1 hypothetical protein ASE76_17825 [Xylophilus sp. Leaf220]